MSQSAVPEPGRRRLSHRVQGRGDPLVLIAGTGFPGATWAPALLDPLSTRHAVVTFDHRGTGDTPAGPEPLSTRLFAEDAVGLLDELGVDAAHVVGHSMGGRVAQWMALDHPERVRSLVLAATGPGQFRDDRPVTRGVPVHTAVDLAERGYEAYMRAHIAATFFTPEFVKDQPEAVWWLFDAFWEHRPSLEDYLRHVVARQEHQTTERLGAIRAPVLVMIGDRDTHVAGTGIHWEQSASLLALIPEAERAVIPGAAHGFFWQEPERSAAILLGWTSRH